MFGAEQRRSVGDAHDDVSCGGDLTNLKSLNFLISIKFQLIYIQIDLQRSAYNNREVHSIIFCEDNLAQNHSR